MQVGKFAGEVDVPPFEPRKGVQIETDPKATKAVSITQDDESAIESLINALEVSGELAPCRLALTERLLSHGVHGRACLLGCDRIVCALSRRLRARTSRLCSSFTPSSLRRTTIPTTTWTSSRARPICELETMALLRSTS